MVIFVAGEKREYPDGLTVAQLIVEENVETPEYVTVTLGNRFLQKSELETTVLQNGDSVEFLYYMGGGR